MHQFATNMGGNAKMYVDWLMKNKKYLGSMLDVILHKIRSN